MSTDEIISRTKLLDNEIKVIAVGVTQKYRLKCFTGWQALFRNICVDNEK